MDNSQIIGMINRDKAYLNYYQPYANLGTTIRTSDKDNYVMPLVFM